MYAKSFSKEGGGEAGDDLEEEDDEDSDEDDAVMKNLLVQASIIWKEEKRKYKHSIEKKKTEKTIPTASLVASRNTSWSIAFVKSCCLLFMADRCEQKKALVQWD